MYFHLSFLISLFYFYHMVTQRSLFLRHLAQTSDAPLALEIEKASGVYMYTKEGKAILDLISGIAVSNIGHCHPAVVKAIQHQSETFMHLMVYGELIQSPQVLLAEAMVKTLPAQLDSVYFVNSGSEAVEGALKLAKRFTGRPHLISCVNAYHGSSHGSLSMMGNEFFKQAFRPLLPGVSHIRFGKAEDLSYITEQTAAIIIEPIQGEAGIMMADASYFKALYQRCKETGCLLIFDEIQTGFGRTGTFWFLEQLGVTPDILVCAKGMGGGMPIGAFISRTEIMRTLTHDPFLGHITTFGGHPVSCAASLATLQTILAEGLPQKASAKAKLFRSKLIHPSIIEIRGTGLMMAIELEDAVLVQSTIAKALEKGLLTDWFLFKDTALRLVPPLTITEDEIEKACTILLESLNEARS
ncbi:MAG: aminotransferase class [Cytophagaceae bacterium]|jgi:acetylornithine/succinyldiaminopimelate/putrescine aminotransferase|nr:aminotransferase class [Cytophagaceae bacterium]